MKDKITCSKALFCILFYWGLSFFSTALALTNEDQAKLAAQNFLGFIGSPKSVHFAQPMNSNLLDPSKPAVLSGWLMALSDGGYVLISSSRAVSPVKAYSLDTAYTALPLPYRRFLEQELELYARIEAEAVTENPITPRNVPEKSRAEIAWSFLLDQDTDGRRVLAYTPDTHLLTTTWNQGYPYNTFLPRMDGRNVLAGCVNIALAQVMKYHGYPDSGAGTTTYSWNNEQLKTILYHPYHWENMPDAPGMSTDQHLQDEVAILIRDLGIVNQTAFGLSFSSAYLHQDAFVRFFGYSSSMASMDNTQIDTFFSTLKTQIDQELPVLLSFPGHMVVVDGYAADLTGRKFHINMGWGGLDDNYYFLDDPVTTSSYIFQPDLDIIYNIKPCSGPDCVYPSPPVADIPPVFNTLPKDIIIKADDTTPHLIRIDARDENGDDIVFSIQLSNSETIAAEITNDVLTLSPRPGSLNKAAALKIIAQAGDKTSEIQFLVMATEHLVTFGKAQDIKGMFDSQADTNTHFAILEGETTLAGDRGYSNQAFYIGVRDSQGQVIISETDQYSELHHDFPFGVYTLSASLCSGSCYTYTPGNHDDYVIQVDAPAADAGIQQIAGLLAVDLSKTDLLPPGDLNNDGQVNLEDKLLALKIITLSGDTDAFDSTDDVNGDGRVGIEEALFW